MARTLSNQDALTARIAARKPAAGVSGPVAVVMGLGITGLAVGRALGRRGIQVIGIGGARHAGAHSRYIRIAPGSDTPHDEAVLEHYTDLGRQLDEPGVLLPTGDPNVLFIARHREVLSAYFRFHVADTDLLETIASKRRFVAVAERLALPIPRTVVPACRADLTAAIERLSFPCVIKPEFTHLWRSPAATSAGLAEIKAIPVDDASALLRWYDRLAAIDARLIVQDMVVGSDDNHVDYHALTDRDGAVRAEFVGRKLRVAPAHYGSGSYVESIREPDVLNLGRCIVERLGYRGMVNMNLKRDSRTGRLSLLEINPRFSTWTALDVACEVDFPYYYYAASLGNPYRAPAQYRTGVRWVNPVPDVRAMRVYLREGTWTRRQWLASVSRASVNAIFAWDDPGPAWATVKASLRQRLGPTRRMRRRSEEDERGGS